MLCLLKSEVNGLGGGFTDIGIAIGQTMHGSSTSGGTHITANPAFLLLIVIFGMFASIQLNKK